MPKKKVKKKKVGRPRKRKKVKRRRKKKVVEKGSLASTPGRPPGRKDKKRRKRSMWTVDQINFLQENYHKMSNMKIAKEVKKSLCGVKLMADRLGFPRKPCVSFCLNWDNIEKYKKEKYKNNYVEGYVYYFELGEKIKVCHFADNLQKIMEEISSKYLNRENNEHYHEYYYVDIMLFR